MKKHIRSRVKDFNIRGDNPKVLFLLNKAEQVPSSTPGQAMTQLFPELRIEDATDAADNLFFVLNDFLQSHQRTALTPAFVFISICVMVFTTLLGNQGIVKHQPTLGVMWLAASVVLVVIVLLWFNRGHSLTLDTKLESPSFFARNREEFSKQAVTAAISGLIGGVIGYLFGHYLK